MGIARTIAKNTLFNFIGSGSELIIIFITGMVLARTLGPERYGLYAYLMWFLSLSAMIMNLGMGDMSKRFIAEAVGRQSPGESKGLVRLTLTVRGGAALVIASVILISSGYWARLTGDSSNQIYFVLLAFATLPHALNYVLMSIFNGFQKYEYSAYVILGTSPLRLIAIIVLMALGFGIREVLIAHMAILALGALIGFILLRRLIPFKDLLSASLPESDTRKRALKYALAMTGLHGTDYLAYQQAEVYIIQAYSAVAMVGFYTLATKLSAVAMTFVPTAFSLVLLPAVAEQFGRGDIQKIKAIYLTSTRYLMIVVFPLAAAVIALANPIVTLLYGVEYAQTVSLMRIMILPIAITSISGAAGAVILGINRPDFSLKTGALFAVLNIGLNLWLVPKYGVMGAAIASSVPRLLNFPLYIGFASRKIGATWPIWDTVRIVLAATIMGLSIYAVQSHVGIILSLVLGIPLGIAVYLIGILVLGVIRGQDLVILKGIEKSLPLTMRKHYAPVVGLVERILVRTKLVARQ